MGNALRKMTFAVLLCLAASVCGCGRDEDAAEGETPATVREPVPAETDPVAVERPPSDAVTYFDFERLLPESPMLVWYSGGASSIGRLSRDSAVASIWLDEGLGESLRTPYENLRQMLSDVAFIPQPAINLALLLLEAAATSPSCLVIESIDIDMQEMMERQMAGEGGGLEGVRMAWMLHAPPESRALEAADTISMLIQLAVEPAALEKEGPVTRIGNLPAPVAWGLRDDMFVIAVGEGVAEAMLADEPRGPGGEFENLRETITAGAEPVAFWHIGIGELFGVYHEVYRQFEEFDEIAGMMEDVKETIQTLSMAVIAGEKGFRELSALRADLPEAVLDISMSADDLRAVPADARFLLATASDFDSIYETIENYHRMASGNRNEQPAPLEEMEAELGLSIRGDLVGAMGEKVMFYTTDAEDGGLWPDPVLTLELKDADKFRGSLEKIVGHLTPELEESGAASITTGEHNGTAFHRIEFDNGALPFDPAWAVTESHLVLSGTLPALTAALDHIKSGEKGSIIDSKEFREAFDRVGREEFTTLYYAGSAAKKKLIEALYGLLDENGQLAGLAEEFGFSSDILPPADSLAGRLFATIDVTYHGDGMIFSDGFGPLGGSGCHVTGALLGAVSASVISGIMTAHEFMSAMSAMEDGMAEEVEMPVLSRDELIEAVGPQLVDAGGGEVGSSVLKEKQYVLLYFSAEWCQPCRQFTPPLVAFYDEHSEKAALETVLVSSDGSAESMFGYMQDYDMNWLAVPHDRVEASRLSELYSVRGIPRLIALDSEGNVIKDSDALGREAMLQELAEMF